MKKQTKKPQIDVERYLLFTDVKIFFINRKTRTINMIERKNDYLYQITVPDENSQNAINDETMHIMQSYGFAAEFVGIVGKTLECCIGKTYEEFLNHIQRAGKSAIYDRKNEKIKRETYAEMRRLFRDFVIDIDTSLDVRTDKDFSIRLQLRSSVSFEEQVEFVKTHQRELINFTVQYISRNERMMRTVGRWGFWRVSDIVVTRTSEVELMFSLKGKLEKVLDET